MSEILITQVSAPDGGPGSYEPFTKMTIGPFYVEWSSGRVGTISKNVLQFLLSYSHGQKLCNFNDL